ncbi:hypothetical protein FisN_12Hh047 [Fistulifera solaris]|uniref:Uncharacterized protein n=1 Tax=Fistulifera solaris TaxID=1519565 RepID=A0A1Z5K230_FISSO|nr:hypothetical protein FisN_12Hh047 [Fistulifera solaris]|eukprot:GAX20202.1 hypothetical protein FisN_12Hh047 [Fistulifera solaris]
MIQEPPKKSLSVTTLLQPPAEAAQHNVWDILVPAMWENERYLDVTVHWALDEGCYLAAEKCVAAIKEQLPIHKHRAWVPRKDAVKKNIASSMQSFVTYCSEHLYQAPPQGFKARLVCGRGISSAKCPRWHVDQVPVRYIQALVGPGCQYLDCQGPLMKLNETTEEDDDQPNNAEEDTSSSLHDYVERLVQRHPEYVQQTREGEAVILVGNEWADRTAHPCIHKSPSGLMPWNGRILFTIDVVC